MKHKYLWDMSERNYHDINDNKEDEDNILVHIKEEKEGLLDAYVNSEIDREEYAMQIENLDNRMKVKWIMKMSLL